MGWLGLEGGHTEKQDDGNLVNGYELTTAVQKGSTDTVAN